MASFENYNLPYNYTTAVTLTKTLSILVSVNFLTCGWTPNQLFTAYLLYTTKDLYIAIRQSSFQNSFHTFLFVFR